MQEFSFYFPQAQQRYKLKKSRVSPEDKKKKADHFVCKEITNRLHLQGGFTMIFCLHLCTCIRDYTLLPPVMTETNVYLVASKDFALQVQLPITTWAANCGKAIEPLLQFVYSKFEICAFNIFIVSCYRYCL